MSIDKLQERIRKLKNPSVVDFGIRPEHIPPHLMQAHDTFASAYEQFCKELLHGLADVVAGVRFSLGSMAAIGPEGVLLLKDLLNTAQKLGYYVILDGPAVMSAQEAEFLADMLLNQESEWCFDGLILTPYIGSDGIKPFTMKLNKTNKDLFVVVRTANRSAPELQDLLTGSRLVHLAAADIVKRFAEPMIAKCGYSNVAAVAAASSADSLRTLREKYKSIFLLLDGYDYPNANAKNCSAAFDKLGHGAAACAGTSVTAAWLDAPGDAQEYVSQAIEAAQRMKKNLTRYIVLL